MTGIEFDGEIYNDDRLFVLHISKCTVRIAEDDVTETTIYHEEAPRVVKWCVVTYRNVERYPAIRVDHFESFKAAEDYMKEVEPTVPLISLGGKSPKNPLPYDQFLKWKSENHLKEYDHRKMYQTGGANPKEVIFSKGQQTGMKFRSLTLLTGGKGRTRKPQPETVLIVEDDKTMRDLIVSIVKDGHPDLRIETAADGAEAIEKITHQALPSILITNVMMPRMTGIELLTALHRKGIVLPTIVVSGYYTPEAFEDWFLNEQFPDREQFLFLEKPFRIEQMKTWINAIMESTS